MRRRLWWIAAAVVVIGAPLAWYLGSPLFINRTVVEEISAVVVRSRGTFVGADSFHQGSGDALLVEAGGQAFVRLENFRVTNGPDLYVYLSSHPNPRTREQVHEGTVNLGRLKGNIGAQNYTLPAGTDLSAVHSVVIYCQRFHVLFATAALRRTP